MRVIQNIDTLAWTKTRMGGRTTKVNGKYVSQSEYYSDDRTSTAPLNRMPWYISSKSIGAQPMSASTNNRLAARLTKEMSTVKGELLTSMIEAQDTFDMITNRARQLGAAYLAVRNGKFNKAASILSMSHVPRNVRVGSVKRQSPTALWLEYWLGWAPLMGDIGLISDVINNQKPIYNQAFSVGVTQVDVWRVYSHDVVVPDRLVSTSDINYAFNTHFTAYGKARVTNQNYRLATQLGLTNPALTAWQLVPFSFIVDWVVNVGQVLNSYAEFLPFELYDTGQAFKTTGTVSSYQSIVNHFAGVYVPRINRQTAEGYVLRRTPGALPRPRLMLSLPDRLSLTRAATSISLLTEIFLRK